MTYIKTIADDEAEGTVAKIYEQGRKAGGAHQWQVTSPLPHPSKKGASSGNCC